MYLPPPSDEFHTCHFRGNPQRKMRFMGTLRCSLPRTDSTRALSRKSWDEGSRLLHASSLSYILMREAREKALDMSAARAPGSPFIPGYAMGSSCVDLSFTCGWMSPVWNSAPNLAFYIFVPCGQNRNIK